MDLDLLERIRNRVRSTMASRHEIIGAQLGMIVKREAPGLDFRRDFGGLRHFAEEHLAGIVTWKSKEGLDDWYLAAGATATHVEDWRKVEGETEFLWNALTHPKTRTRFACDPAAGELFISYGKAPLPEGLAPLATFSVEDYRRIATEYLPQLPPSARSSFEDILSAANFWNTWYLQVRAVGLGASWETWRVNQVVAEFARRLDAAGFSESARSRWADVLSQSRVQSRQRSSKTQPERRVGSTSVVDARKVGSTSVMDARQLAKAALDHLSEEDARQLRLPMGAIVDALRLRR